MIITCALVDMILKIYPEKFKGYLVYEKGRKAIYAVVLRAIYGMLVASLLWYHNSKKDLKSVEFVFNNDGPCVANRVVNEK